MCSPDVNICFRKWIKFFFPSQYWHKSVIRQSRRLKRLNPKQWAIIRDFEKKGLPWQLLRNWMYQTLQLWTLSLANRRPFFHWLLCLVPHLRNFPRWRSFFPSFIIGAKQSKSRLVYTKAKPIFYPYPETRMFHHSKTGSYFRKNNNPYNSNNSWCNKARALQASVFEKNGARNNSDIPKVSHFYPGARNPRWGDTCKARSGDPHGKSCLRVALDIIDSDMSFSRGKQNNSENQIEFRGLALNCARSVFIKSRLGNNHVKPGRRVIQFWEVCRTNKTVTKDTPFRRFDSALKWIKDDDTGEPGVAVRKCFLANDAFCGTRFVAAPHWIGQKSSYILRPVSLHFPRCRATCLLHTLSSWRAGLCV